ncbi:hypothetical protein ABC383_01330 [Noviherbaspirillum sp. 1P10PC]|uniref:hypothetical protein n=1 Tax=Noviherbaspirillum sp. 1P10PC TaxID=3132292 RepID=UPI0039A399ED
MAQTDAAPFPAPGTADTARSTGLHCHFKSNGNGNGNFKSNGNLRGNDQFKNNGNLRGNDQFKNNGGCRCAKRNRNRNRNCFGTCILACLPDAFTFRYEPERR